MREYSIRRHAATILITPDDAQRLLRNYAKHRLVGWGYCVERLIEIAGAEK